MIKTRIWMLAILLLSFVVVSCEKEEDPPAINESEVLVEFLESVNSPLGKDYVSTDMPAIKTAEYVHGLNNAGKVYIMDIRSAADYGAGHIENAVNVAAGDVLSHIQGVNLSGYDEVSIVCYSGQTAAWATCLLRLAGYSNVFSMKFGMCGWHSDYAGSWNNSIGNTYATQFTSDATEKGPSGDLPTLGTGLETGQDIFDARLAVVLTEGFGAAKISNSEVFSNLDNYYIVNYWPADEYTSVGHIPGAMQYTPKTSMKLDADLKTLPTDKTIVVYCYTGQTSANLAAYLRVLGYDAKSLLFGVNAMNYDGLTTSKWTETTPKDYPVVTK